MEKLVSISASMDLIETVSQAPGCSHFSSCPTVMYSTQPKSTNMLFPHLNILNRLAPMISQSCGDLLRVLGATDTITSKDMLTTYSTQHCCVEYFGTIFYTTLLCRIFWNSRKKYDSCQGHFMMVLSDQPDH